MQTATDPDIEYRIQLMQVEHDQRVLKVENEKLNCRMQYIKELHTRDNKIKALTEDIQHLQNVISNCTSCSNGFIQQSHVHTTPHRQSSSDINLDTASITSENNLPIISPIFHFVEAPEINRNANSSTPIDPQWNSIDPSPPTEDSRPSCNLLSDVAKVKKLNKRTECVTEMATNSAMTDIHPKEITEGVNLNQQRPPSFTEQVRRVRVETDGNKSAQILKERYHRAVSLPLVQVAPAAAVSENGEINDIKPRLVLSFNTRKPSHIYPHKCNTCGARFKVAQKLCEHRNMHLGIYKCKHCGRLFANNSTLISHERTHSGETAHKCSDCDSTFAVAYNLAAHRRRVHGENAIKCDKCKETFVTRVQLRQHSQVHENDTRKKSLRAFSCEPQQMNKDRSTTSDGYKCNVCNKAFRTADHLSKHCTTAHGGKFACSKCAKAFETSELLATHYRKHLTADKKHKCDQCNATYSQESMLQRHKQTHWKQ